MIATTLVANSGKPGIYHAQDKSPLSTCAILRSIVPSKKSLPCQRLLRPFSVADPVKRFFGGVAYTEELASCELGEYQIIPMAEGIRRTIG